MEAVATMWQRDYLADRPWRPTGSSSQAVTVALSGRPTMNASWKQYRRRDSGSIWQTDHERQLEAVATLWQWVYLADRPWTPAGSSNHAVTVGLSGRPTVNASWKQYRRRDSGSIWQTDHERQLEAVTTP